MNMGSVNERVNFLRTGIPRSMASTLSAFLEGVSPGANRAGFILSRRARNERPARTKRRRIKGN